MTRYTLPQLMAAAYDLQVPFEVDLGENRVLAIETVLRTLPGKRIVAKAGGQDKNTLVKIFFQRRNFERENSGYQRLHSSDIQTPNLLSAETLAEGGICHYEFIDKAQSFSARWQAADAKTKIELLAKLLSILQQYYQNNLCQTDLHLDNFIFAGDKLFALDPASCEKLSASTIINNLALLLAQFPFAEWTMVASAVIAQFPEVNREALTASANVQQKIRRDNFLQKIYRESTYTQVWKTGKKYAQHFAVICNRQRATSAMRGLLDNINVIPENVEILKRGNSSLVLSRNVDGKKIVIKNSRNKNIWRLLRRCLRRSRASNSWYFAHMLQDAGINVPAPLALVERKLGPFVLESWFISECVEGDNLLDVWLYQKPSPQELQAISELFATLQQLQISHGDMKATNLLVCDEKIFVIDYDGASEHTSKAQAQKALKKDRERFLANWSDAKLKTTILETLLATGVSQDE